MGVLDQFGILPRRIFWLKCLYYTLKLNGLVCFNLSLRPPHATTSTCRQWTLYSLLFTIFITLKFNISIFVHLDMFIPKEIVPIESQTLYMVSAVLLVLNAEKSNLLYILQFCNRHKLLCLINDGFDLHNNIIFMCQDVEAELMDKTKILIRKKVTATLFQIAIFYTAVFSIKSVSYHIFLLVYSHWISVMITSMFLCGLYIMWQFYRLLNQKLKQCMAKIKRMQTSKMCKMRMQHFCDLSDDIDRLACLYSRCLNFTSQMNQYFSATLFMTIAYAFVLIVSQLFFIYDQLTKVVTGTSSATSDLYICGWILLYYIFDVYSIVSLSNALINEALQTGKMLYILDDDIDDRLSRSVS